MTFPPSPLSRPHSASQALLTPRSANLAVMQRQRNQFGYPDPRAARAERQAAAYAEVMGREPPPPKPDHEPLAWQWSYRGSKAEREALGLSTKGAA